MMFAADTTPIVETVPVNKPAEVVVVRRDTRSDVLVNRDTPLPLLKAPRTEDAVLLQVVFVTSTLTVVRPATGPDVLRWTYEPYLQRQLCFTSITGLFSCAAAEVEELAEKASGETPLTAQPDPAASHTNAVAEAARTAVTNALRTRSSALFDADRRLKLIPMLRAAGVSVRSVPPSPARR